VPTSGMSSAHLLLNGLAGLLLGWAVFPALLVGLFLQAVLFGFGGITTLGVNTVTMALPGVVVYLLVGPLVSRKPALSAAGGLVAGAGGVFLAAVLYAAAWFFSGRAFWAIAGATLVVHLPVMAVEGAVCAFCVAFLRRVRPQMLPYARREVVHDG
jgi:cobalt/nickel transport system permease protein